MTSVHTRIAQGLNRLVLRRLDTESARARKEGKLDVFDGYANSDITLAPEPPVVGLKTGKNLTDADKESNKKLKAEAAKNNKRPSAMFSMSSTNKIAQDLETMVDIVAKNIGDVNGVKPEEFLKYLTEERPNTVITMIINSTKMKSHITDDMDLLAFLRGIFDTKLADNLMGNEEERKANVTKVASVFSLFIRKIANNLSEDAWDTRADVLETRSLHKKMSAPKKTTSVTKVDAESESESESESGSDDDADMESDEETVAVTKKVVKVVKEKKAPNLHQTITPNIRVYRQIIRGIMRTKENDYGFPASTVIRENFVSRTNREIIASNETFVKNQAKKAEKAKNGGVSVVHDGKKKTKDLMGGAFIPVATDEVE
jgi:hypothetical protein